MRVTLLGTGCPVVDVHRYGPAALIEGAGDSDTAWLVDCGSGVTQRLLAHGRSGAALSGLLLTHLHSDHTVDLMQLLISGWHQGRTAPLRVFGPRGTRDFLSSIRAAWQPELEQRMTHELRQPEGLALDITEIAEGWQLTEQGLRISCTEVRHQPVPQAFAFRFDALDFNTIDGPKQGASAVISGDTAYSPELIALAQGCDLLVHEAFVHWAFEATRKHLPQATRDNVSGYHTLTSEVGQVATQAGAGHLALTHFVPPEFDQARVLAEVQAHYSGPISIGEDLMSFAVTQGHTRLLP